MDNNKQELKRIDFERIIWIAFIISGILTLYADNLEKKYLIYSNKNAHHEAKKIYFSLLIVSLLIYIYFTIRNYHDLQKYKNSSQENLYRLRFIATVLFLIGTILLLYFQNNNEEHIGIESI